MGLSSPKPVRAECGSGHDIGRALNVDGTSHDVNEIQSRTGRVDVMRKREGRATPRGRSGFAAFGGANLEAMIGSLGRRVA